MNLFDFDIVGTVDLDEWYKRPVYSRYAWIYQQLKPLYQPIYEPNQRILLNLSKGDEYQDLTSVAGNIVRDLIKCLWQLDISAFFIIIKTPDPGVQKAVDHLRSTGSYDSVPWTVILDREISYEKRLVAKETSPNMYSYNNSAPIHIKIEDLTDPQRKLQQNRLTLCI